jgi:hypothetical protein
MKASSKKRLKKLEETLKEKSDPLDPVVIYDPQAPLPDLSQFGDQVVILLPDNRRHPS